jgi:hypothetical protein
MRIPLLVLFIMLSSLLRAQIIESGSLHGVIVDAATKEPVSGAMVRLRDTRLAAVTDSSGAFSIPEIYPDMYTVIATLSGYTSDTLQGVVVSANKTTVLRIELSLSTCCDQNNSSLPPFDKKRAWIVGAAQGALVTGSLIGLNELWYKQYPRERFHTFNDNAEWMQMDKIGHVQSSYTIAQISTNLWDLSHMRHRRGTWIGGLTSFGYLTAIELMDGYSSGWGFSVGDMIANTAGSAFFISQELVWGEQRIVPKFGFSPSPYAKLRPELLGETLAGQIIKDYNGQTYWLSVNVASFLQSDTRVPRWLNIAVGYGANGMTGGHENPVMYNSAGNEITVNRYRQYYLSLDIDLRRLRPRNKFLRLLCTTFAFIKIPAPAVEVNKYGLRGHILKF